MKKGLLKNCLIALAVWVAIILFSMGFFFIFDAHGTVVSADSVSVWDGTSDTSWYVGHESDEEYTLTSAAQLAGLQTLANESNIYFVNKTVNLDIDVDLNGCKALGVGDNKGQAITTFTDADTRNVWTPIIRFEGVFNGQGHTIFNLSIKEGRYAEGMGYDSGFVSYLTNGATIKNLTFKNAIVSGTKNVGVVVGKSDGGVLNNLTVEDSKVLLGHSCAGGIAGVATSLNKCYVRGLTIDCSLGGTRLIGGLIGGGAADNADPVSVSITKSEIYNFALTDCPTPEYTGLFAGNKSTLTIGECLSNITTIPLSSGDFTVVGGDGVTYKNIDETSVGGNVVENTSGGFVAHTYDATDMQGSQVVITFVSAPTSIQIDCTDADSPAYDLSGRTLSFTIPDSATALTVSAEMLGAGTITASFTLGENTPPPAPTPTSITIQIDDKESVYGSPILPLTAQIVSGTLREGDDLYSVVTLAKEDGEYVNTYDITVVATSPDYDVEWEPATYTITQKPLTLVIDNKTSEYGEALVSLTAHLNGDGLKEGDNLADMLALSKQEGTAVGTYVITGGITNTNYLVKTLVNGTYTISPRSITVAVADAESEYSASLKQNALTLKSGTLKAGDSLDEIVETSSPSSFASGTYEIVATCTSQNYQVTFEYTAGNHSTYTITKKDATALISFSIQDGEQIFVGQTVEATLDLAGVQLVKVLTLDGEAVDDTSKAGNYVLTARIDSGNYSGEKSITFVAIENVDTKMTALANLLAIYGSTTATNEQKINALFDAQSVYAHLTDNEIAQINANQEYSALVAEFVQAWNETSNNANQDLQTASSVYDKTLAILLGAVTSATMIAFIVMKAALH